MNSQQNSMVMWAIFIVVLGIMIAVAIPNYISISNELRIAKARNLAAGLTAATAVNFTQKKFDPSKGIVISNCQDVIKITGTPGGHQISDQEVQSEIITHCTLSGPGLSAIKFSEIGAR